jgi:cysteine desulfurase
MGVLGAALSLTKEQEVVLQVFTACMGIVYVIERMLIVFSSNSSGDKSHTHSGIGQPHPSMLLKQYGGVVYMDYNATTPIFPEVSAAMQPYCLTSFGNPSSDHVYGRPCAAAIACARAHVGALINAQDAANEIIFTSCGSESDNRAIDIALQRAAGREAATHETNWSPMGKARRRPHVITSSVEHPAVLVYLRHLCDTKAIALTVCGVDVTGCVDVAEVKGALTRETVLVTVMHSNNESGAVQPIADIVQAVRVYCDANTGVNILVHSDAAQSLGKVTMSVMLLLVLTSPSDYSMSTF